MHGANTQPENERDQAFRDILNVWVRPTRAAICPTSVRLPACPAPAAWTYEVSRDAAVHDDDDAIGTLEMRSISRE